MAHHTITIIKANIRYSYIISDLALADNSFSLAFQKWLLVLTAVQLTHS